MARRARHLTNRTRLEELVADRCLPSLAGRSMADLARRLPQQNHVWVEARRRFRLSHIQVQMARELGMNPKKLGKLANDRLEPWKEPLPSSSRACT